MSHDPGDTIPTLFQMVQQYYLYSHIVSPATSWEWMEVSAKTLEPLQKIIFLWYYLPYVLASLSETEENRVIIWDVKSTSAIKPGNRMGCVFHMLLSPFNLE